MTSWAAFAWLTKRPQPTNAQELVYPWPPPYSLPVELRVAGGVSVVDDKETLIKINTVTTLCFNETCWPRSDAYGFWRWYKISPSLFKPRKCNPRAARKPLAKAAGAWSNATDERLQRLQGIVREPMHIHGSSRLCCGLPIRDTGCSLCFRHPRTCCIFSRVFQCNVFCKIVFLNADIFNAVFCGSFCLEFIKMSTVRWCGRLWTCFLWVLFHVFYSRHCRHPEPV